MHILPHPDMGKKLFAKPVRRSRLSVTGALGPLGFVAWLLNDAPNVIDQQRIAEIKTERN